MSLNDTSGNRNAATLAHLFVKSSGFPRGMNNKASNAASATANNTASKFRLFIDIPLIGGSHPTRAL
jgi:hypothetical protein